jgi:drug/metabolite transporter (DMT)-like permease
MRRAYVKYISSLLLFGCNGIVASHISLTSYEIVFFRALFGGALLAALFLFSRRGAPSSGGRRAFALVALSGAAMGASWMFLYEAYDRIGVGAASLVYYCGPVIVMALSPVLFGEKLTRAKVAGFAAVLCGLFLVNGRVSGEGLGAFGLFCGAMAAVTYALMLILNKSAKGMDGLENSLVQLVFGFIVTAAFVGFREGPHISVASGDWLPILVLGLVNTGFGCYLYFSSIGRLPVQSVAICGYIEPLTAVLLSAALLGERLGPWQTLGAFLILGGAAAGEALSLRRSAKQRV